MRKNMIIEVCVDSLQSSIAAMEGGADRLELCGSLNEGGLTPSFGLIELVLEYIEIDINVMIRPRAGDFCYSDLEFEVMKRDIEIAKSLGVNGIVVGILKPNGEVDIERMKEIVEIAKPLSITFHRAFDMTKDPFKALSELIRLNVDRILTSGQKNTAIEGIDLIRDLVKEAKDKIIIMAGSGINDKNINGIIEGTKIKELHLSGRKSVKSKMVYRNSDISMGKNVVPSEYENFFTDQKNIQKIRDIC